MLFVPLDPVSLVRYSIINAGTEKDAQKTNGIPGLILARLLPRGGKAVLPIFSREKTIPTAIPEYLAPTPSVSNNIAKDIDIDPSKKIPANNIKNHILPPSTIGVRLIHTSVTISAR